MTSPTSQGLQKVTIGKKGSRKLSSELLKKILEEWKVNQENKTQKVNLCLGLYLKGISKDEATLFEYLEIPTPITLSTILSFFLEQEPTKAQFISLSNSIIQNKDYQHDNKILEEAALILTSQNNQLKKSILSTLFRVLYLNNEGYSIIYQKFFEFIPKTFTSPSSIRSKRKKSILISEPFDGVERSFLMTPIIAKLFIEEGFNVIIPAENSCGPKYGINTQCLYKTLAQTDSKYNNIMYNSLSLSNECENLISKESMHPLWHDWSKLRMLLMKRNFLATLEKMFRFYSADYLLTTAFHTRYIDIMLSLGKKLNYENIFIASKGREGSLTVALNKTYQIHCASREKDNKYSYRHFDFQNNNEKKLSESQNMQVSTVTNAQYISDFLSTGKSQSQLFNLQANSTLEVYKQLIKEML